MLYYIIVTDNYKISLYEWNLTLFANITQNFKI